MSAIVSCRTAALGGHVTACEDWRPDPDRLQLLPQPPLPEVSGLRRQGLAGRARSPSRRPRCARPQARVTRENRLWGAFGLSSRYRGEPSVRNADARLHALCVHASRLHPAPNQSRSTVDNGCSFEGGITGVGLRSRALPTSTDRPLARTARCGVLTRANHGSGRSRGENHASKVRKGPGKTQRGAFRRGLPIDEHPFEEHRGARRRRPSGEFRSRACSPGKSARR